MAAYPEEIRKAAADRAPHRIAHFVYEMAGLFHAFYNNCHIIQSDKGVGRSSVGTGYGCTDYDC